MESRKHNEKTITWIDDYADTAISGKSARLATYIWIDASTRISGAATWNSPKSTTLIQLSHCQALQLHHCSVSVRGGAIELVIQVYQTSLCPGLRLLSCFFFFNSQYKRVEGKRKVCRGRRRDVKGVDVKGSRGGGIEEGRGTIVGVGV